MDFKKTGLSRSFLQKLLFEETVEMNTNLRTKQHVKKLGKEPKRKNFHLFGKTLENRRKKIIKFFCFFECSWKKAK